MSMRPLHTKANRIEIKKGPPSPNEGNNGELRLGVLSKGIFLYVKYGNRWYQLGDAAISSSGQFSTQSIASQGGGKLATSIDRGDESLRMGGKIILGDNVITQQGSSSGVKFDSSENLTLDSANNLVLDAANANGGQGLQFLLNGTKVGDITGHHANTYFTLYENVGASTSDYFAIKCGANGDSDIITVDATGATAHLNITPDGQLTLNPVSTLTFQPTGALMIRKSMFQQEQASADADQVAYGQIWVKNATPNELYFTNDAGNDIQITSGSSMAGGGGSGTDTWETTVGGYKTNNNSSTYYYTQYYSGYHTWTRSDTTPTSIDDYAVYTSVFTAQKDGTLTSIKFMGRASDTGVTDPFKVYVYKAAPAHGDTTTTATLIGTSSTITPGGTLRNVVSTTAISSSNSFSAGDSLYVWYKKDSTSGSQDLYFQISISGEYD